LTLLHATLKRRDARQPPGARADRREGEKSHPAWNPGPSWFSIATVTPRHKRTMTETVHRRLKVEREGKVIAQPGSRDIPSELTNLLSFVHPCIRENKAAPWSSRTKTTLALSMQ
jgi:hypothetical protein